MGWLLVVATLTTVAEAGAQTEPELLLPGLVSTPAIEYGAALSPSGDTLYFTRRASFDESPQILWTTRSGDGWSAPAPVPFAHPDGDEFPSVAPDGNALYFASARPVHDVDQRDRNDMWIVDRTPDGWSEPRHLGGDLSTPDVDSHPVVTELGLLFHSRRPGGSGGVDAYLAPRESGGWGDPDPLPFNSSATDGEVVPVPGHDLFVFYSDREGGFGRGDLYSVSYRGDRWGSPVNLGSNINTSGWEWAPTFHPDGRFVFARLTEDASRSDLYIVVLEYPDRSEGPAEGR